MTIYTRCQLKFNARKVFIELLNRMKPTMRYVKGAWYSIQLVLYAAAFLSLVDKGRSQSPSVRFLTPQDGARLWVDDEHPVVLKFELEGISLPRDGAVGMIVNGGDTGHRFTAPPYQVSMVEVEDRFFTVEAVLFDRNGARTEVQGQTTFFTRRALEFMEHTDYPVAAESPRADGSVAGMPGIEEWDNDVSGPAFYDIGRRERARDSSRRSGPSASSKAHPAYSEGIDVLNEGGGGSPLEFLHRRWGRMLSTEEVMQGKATFEAYAAFHSQVISDPTLWRTNSFLIYRTMDRGLGNQLESLVSAFALAMLTNRVFLVDSTTIHHLFSPPPALNWHYATVSERMNHDEIYDASACLDLRWQNPLGFPPLLCGNLTQAFPAQFLFVFSDQYFLPAMLHNARYTATLRDWLQASGFGADLFGTLSRHLLRPKAWIVKQAVEFYKTHLAGRPSVGIQLRTATMKEHDMAHLVKGMNDDVFAWKATKAEGAVYYIATDNARVKAIADSALHNHSKHYPQQISRASIAGHASALIDLLVLSACDHLVTTTMSTFGYVPAALTGTPPLVVSFQSTCLRDVTSQPCFHKWGYLMEAECYDGSAMVARARSR